MTSADPILPFITIVVPALNEEARIRDCIASLEQQSYPCDRYEIIIVDNGSTDRTQEIVRGSSARLLIESRKSAYHARNLAIESSQGEWLAFTDADCVADPNWLINLLETARTTNAWIVGGLIVYDVLSDTLGNRLLVESRAPEELRRRIEHQSSVAGGNMFVCREAINQFGAFRVIRSGSDVEFSQRLARHGHPSKFASTAIVRHQCDLGNWEYLKRTYWIRYGQVVNGLGQVPCHWLVHAITRLPWRPGFGAVRKSPPIAVFPRNTPIVAEWLYRWANRWAGYFGECRGAWDMVRHPSENASESNGTVRN